MDYKGVDYYFLDDLLTDEEKAIRQTIREFVNEEVLPIIEKYNQEMKFPDYIKKAGNPCAIHRSHQPFGGFNRN